jgi:D-serine deaminase-like pyridoxal phosphate-dependent protein
MSPELAARQLAYRAWGITVAGIGQLQTYRAFGFPRLLQATGTLTVAGVAGYEGTITGGEGEVAAFCRRLRALAGRWTTPAARPSSRPAAVRTSTWWPAS